MARRPWQRAPLLLPAFEMQPVHRAVHDGRSEDAHARHNNQRAEQRVERRKHFQVIATEVTVIIEGKARMGDQILGANDIIVLDPKDSYDFEALTEVTLVAVKFPSIPNDKVLD